MEPHKTYEPDVYDNPEPCEECGGVVRIGDFPLCGGDPTKHQRPEHMHRPFAAITDINLGEYRPNGKGGLQWHPAHVTSQAERKAIMRRMKLDYHGRGMGDRGCEF